tara:strand:+ start:7106 stop:7252 length:147 start_codon:yes stop_codon:yes gene_type:complete
MKKAETPTPTKELKKNLVDISVSVKAKSRFMFRNKIQFTPSLFKFLIF